MENRLNGCDNCQQIFSVAPGNRRHGFMFKKLFTAQWVVCVSTAVSMNVRYATSTIFWLSIIPVLHFQFQLSPYFDVADLTKS